MRNEKGFTIFEVLITLSVSSIVLMMLMGLTSNIIFTRNVVEYSNRIDSEMFELTESIRYNLGDTSYSSIYQPEAFDGEVVLITKEFEPIVEDEKDALVLNRDSFRIDILYLDLEGETLYFDILYEHDPNSEISINDYINETLDEDIDTFTTNPSGQIISNRVKLLEGSSLILLSDTEDGNCERTLNNKSDEDNETKYITDNFEIEGFVSLCLSTYIVLDFNMSYELNSGNLMPERDYKTTIFIP